MSLSTAQDIEKMKTCLLYVLQNGGNMEIMKLAKILYLADYLYAKTFGATNGFMGGHERFPYGPVPAQFYPAFNELSKNQIVHKPENENIVTLLQSPGNPNLSDEEMACIDKTLEEFKRKPLNKVKNAAYATEPMVYIQKQEKKLGSKLQYEKMDFDLIKRHPLFEADDLDLSFMDDPEFVESMK